MSGRAVTLEALEAMCAPERCGTKPVFEQYYAFTGFVFLLPNHFFNVHMPLAGLLRTHTPRPRLTPSNRLRYVTIDRNLYPRYTIGTE